MNTTREPNSNHTLGSLKKLAGPVVLAGGLGLAVIGLGAGAANAGPAPEINCPSGVVAGHGSTATLANWPEGTVSVYVGPYAVVLGKPQPPMATITVDQTLAASTTKYLYVPVPPLSPGHHYLAAAEGGSAVPLGHGGGVECQFDVS
jgi:hypothetical protein